MDKFTFPQKFIEMINGDWNYVLNDGSSFHDRLTLLKNSAFWIEDDSDYFMNFVNQLNDPNLIVPFNGDGHYYYCFDWNEKELTEEPRVILVTLEDDLSVERVYQNFEEFLHAKAPKKCSRKEDIINPLKPLRIEVSGDKLSELNGGEFDIVAITGELCDEDAKDINVKRLVLENAKAENLNVLKNISFSELIITEKSKIGNLDYLGLVKNLKSLSIWNMKLPQGFSLKNNIKLKSLSLISVDSIPDSFLQELPSSLNSIIIENVRISDFSFLKKFKSLKELQLQSTGFNLEDFESLSKLKVLALDEIGEMDRYSMFENLKELYSSDASIFRLRQIIPKCKLNFRSIY